MSAAAVRGKYVALLLVFMIILIPLPMFLPHNIIFMVTYALIMAIVGLGFNFLLGYTGLLSFGHAGFFGVAGYAVALSSWYLEIKSFELLFIIAILATVLYALGTGIFAVRLTEIYFALLTLGFSMIIYSLVLKLYDITRGTDGMVIPRPTLFGFQFPDVFIYRYYFIYFITIFLFVILTYVGYIIVNSPFGKTIQAIRDDEIRARLLGINITLYRLVAYVISGIYTGIGGALFALLYLYISPEQLYWTLSGEIVFYTILGGFNYFIGPIIGAFIYTILKVYVLSYFVYWKFLLGAILMLMLYFLPSGVTEIFYRISEYKLIKKIRSW